MNEVRRLVNILNNQPVNIYKILADISSSIPATSRVVGGGRPFLSLLRLRLAYDHMRAISSKRSSEGHTV